MDEQWQVFGMWRDNDSSFRTADNMPTAQALNLIPQQIKPILRLSIHPWDDNIRQYMPVSLVNNKI